MSFRIRSCRLPEDEHVLAWQLVIGADPVETHRLEFLFRLRLAHLVELLDRDLGILEPEFDEDQVTTGSKGSSPCMPTAFPPASAASTRSGP